MKVLFEPDAFKAALRVFLDHTGQKTQRVHNFARSLRRIGKHYIRLADAILASLRLDSGTGRQMTARNHKRLGQFEEPRNATIWRPFLGRKPNALCPSPRCAPPRR